MHALTVARTDNYVVTCLEEVLCQRAADAWRGGGGAHACEKEQRAGAQAAGWRACGGGCSSRALQVVMLSVN